MSPRGITKTAQPVSAAMPPDQLDLLARDLASKILVTDKLLKKLSLDYDRIEKRVPLELTAKMIEIRVAATRRRTLIEVWESIKNQVWLTEDHVR